MNISVKLTHPNKAGFNHAIARTSEDRLRKNGHDVIFHDLYDEKFDAILPYHEIPTDVSLALEIEIHCEEIASADGIVMVHPKLVGTATADPKRLVRQSNETRRCLQIP